MILITPLDQQMYMKQLDSKYGGSIYDHSNPPLNGWRAERQQAENISVARKNQSEPIIAKCEPAVTMNWIAKIANIFILPRIAG